MSNLSEMGAIAGIGLLGLLTIGIVFSLFDNLSS